MNTHHISFNAFHPALGSVTVSGPVTLEVEPHPIPLEVSFMLETDRACTISVDGTGTRPLTGAEWDAIINHKAGELHLSMSAAWHAADGGR